MNQVRGEVAYYNEELLRKYAHQTWGWLTVDELNWEMWKETFAEKIKNMYNKKVVFV